MIKTTNIELWEIMKDGSNGEVFEATDCCLPQYIGTKVKVKAHTERGKLYRCLVNPDATDDSKESLAVLYGCLGTAKFRKVQEYEELTLMDAIKRMQELRLVFIRSNGEYKEFSRYDDFRLMQVDDMSDLLSTIFYKKGSE